MEWKVEIRNKSGVFDPFGTGIKKDIEDLGIVGVKKVSTSQVFIISGHISIKDVQRIAQELLTDPITQEYKIGEGSRVKGEGLRVVEIAYNTGVMDPVEESTKKAIKDLGISGIELVKTERKYFIEGKITDAQFNTICEKLLYNKVIQHVVKSQSAKRIAHSEGYSFKLITVDLLMASDRKLMKISKDGQLFLNLREMQEIKKYFKNLGRNPTDCELETIAQTWSEHCAHKTFRGAIDYKECQSVKVLGIRK